MAKKSQVMNDPVMDQELNKEFIDVPDNELVDVPIDYPDVSAIVPVDAPIVEDFKDAEIVTFGKRDYNTYERLLNNIEKGFTKASDAYVMIATSLWQIHHNEYFRIGNFKNIAQFAEEYYEIKKSTTHNYIKVIEKFGHIENGKCTGLQEEFQVFSCSQLINMLSFTPEQIEAVDPTWSIKKIVDFGKNSLPQKPDPETDGEESGVESAADSDSQSETAPDGLDINLDDGRCFLATFDDLADFEKIKEVASATYNDMKSDPNFKNKHIHYVLELAFD